MWDTIATIAAIVLPVWNVPLIARVVRRQSSEDISLHWALGVWACFLLMAPQGLHSTDPVWRIFNIVNLVFFTAVVVVVLRYRKPRPKT